MLQLPCAHPRHSNIYKELQATLFNMLRNLRLKIFPSEDIFPFSLRSIHPGNIIFIDDVHNWRDIH